MTDAVYLAHTALTFAALHAGHLVGDQVIQRHSWALTKGEPTRAGWWACAEHVAALTVTQMFALALVALATGQGYGPIAAASGLALNAWSHFWADRRGPFRALMDACGKGAYYRSPNGAAALDQTWHIAWLLPVALIVTAPTTVHVAVLSTFSIVVMAVAITAARRQRSREHASAATATRS